MQSTPETSAKSQKISRTEIAARLLLGLPLLGFCVVAAKMAISLTTEVGTPNTPEFRDFDIFLSITSCALGLGFIFINNFWGRLIAGIIGIIFFSLGLISLWCSGQQPIDLAASLMFLALSIFFCTIGLSILFPVKVGKRIVMAIPLSVKRYAWWAFRFSCFSFLSVFFFSLAKSLVADALKSDGVIINMVSAGIVAIIWSAIFPAALLKATKIVSKGFLYLIGIGIAVLVTYLVAEAVGPMWAIPISIIVGALIIAAAIAGKNYQRNK